MPTMVMDDALTLPLSRLRCPETGAPLVRDGMTLSAGTDGAPSYRISDEGIPLFAEVFCTEDARAQQQHYDRVAAAYVENLTYPHTQEYMDYLDRVLRDVVGDGALGHVVELCCGHGEAFHFLGDRAASYTGVDVSLSMLQQARAQHPQANAFFCQGDATRLPLADTSVDTVMMLGGIHHVPDRRALFAEVQRILKPGGALYFREPLSDFVLWRALRAVIYRLSPALDDQTERPLLHRETVPVLEAVGLRTTVWNTHGFIGFCLFMNSDVLIFNRLFRFIPGIRTLTRWFTALDDVTTKLPGLRGSGLQVVGKAVKPRGAQHHG